MNKFYNFISLMLLIMAIFCLVYNKTISESFHILETGEIWQEQLQNTEKKENAPVYNPPVDIDGTVMEIEVNRPVALSGKSKDEIYEIRKIYVEKSIFKNQGYIPSDKVFGQIIDGKPWIANYICHKENRDPLPITGPSEEARFLNNPSMLIALEYPFWFHGVTDYTFCDTDFSTILPMSVKYDASKKEIIVYYSGLPFSTKNDHTFYQFNGLNAVDFGYKYVYLDREKSTYDVEFMQPSNISEEVYELNNFIHLGSSCGVKGGCNNGSPRQQFVEFKNNYTFGSEKGKMIYLKLWKTRPASPNQEPDIVEKIIFK